VKADSIEYSPVLYTNLQAAIAELETGTDTSNTLTLPKGSYDGSFTISSNLTLVGEETATCILSNSTNNSACLVITGNVFVNILNLTFNSANLAISLSANSQANINNNVFSLNSDGTGISLSSNATANIFHNTFFENDVAIQATTAIGIVNNIFSQSGNSILGLSSTATVNNNLFIDEQVANTLGGNHLTGSANFFASSSALDFHLTLGSNAIDGGANLHGADAIDGSTSDLGAYGGNQSDIHPLAVSGFVTTTTSTLATDVDIALSWNNNDDYLILGYFLYYDLIDDQGTYTGDFSPSLEASPLDMGNVTSYSLTDLNLSLTLEAPTGLNATSLDSSLQVSWTAVAGASNYTLSYTKSSSNAESLVTTKTNETISGLTNFAEYTLSVKANRSPSLYLAIAAYYDNNTHLNKLSDFTASTNIVQVGTTESSPSSSTITATPDVTQVYPLLPNNGGGCLLRSDQ